LIKKKKKMIITMIYRGCLSKQKKRKSKQKN
jgi:hypothetical protein